MIYLRGVNTFLKTNAKKNPIVPIYFGHLNIEHENFWPQIIAPTNFNVSRCTDKMSGSFLQLQFTNFTLLQNQNTQLVSLSVKSIHLPHTYND